MKLSKIYGLHAVQSALQHAPDKITRAWIAAQRHDERLGEISQTLLTLGITPEITDRKALDRLAETRQHQGVVVEVRLPSEFSEHDLRIAIANLTHPALYLVLDQIQDPHNLGACLRTADAVGADGVIVTKDNSPGITPAVCKVACGAAETMRVYQVTNLVRCLRWLKEQGIWVFGAAGESSQSAYAADFNVPSAIVLGAEGRGLRRLTRECCDALVALPMRGTVESLNVSVTAGILLYEVLRQRLKP